MTITVTPNQSQIHTALRTFLIAILPSNVAVVRGLDNRVAEPSGSDFVVFTPMRRERIETNVDVYSDVAFTGAISGSVMTISAFGFGSIAKGNPVFGVGVADGTTVIGLGTGTGGLGTYAVSPPQTISSQKLSAGLANYKQPVKVTIQIDVHGPNASDYSQMISTLFRDDYAYQNFLASGFDVVPLYADDPMQMPFQNAEQQWETRYVINAVLQANQVVSGIPLQFADKLSASLTAANELPAS